MVECNDFPFVPEDMPQFTNEVQAKTMISLWKTAALVYSLCAEKQSTLIEWINGAELPKDDDDA